MARAAQREVGCVPGCPVEVTLDIIGGKWKGVILYNLLVDGTMRFNQIRRRLPAVTQRMLTNQLRELEASGLLVRTIYIQAPPRVDYSLTPLGHSLEPIVMALKAWGEAHPCRREVADTDAATPALAERRDAAA